MVNISYRRKKDDTCITKCPYKKNRFVGSLACEACHYHFLKLTKSRTVICRFEDENEKN